MQLLTRHISTLAVDLYFFKKIRTRTSNLFNYMTYRSTEAIISIIY